jgi:hypothetical protein
VEEELKRSESPHEQALKPPRCPCQSCCLSEAGRQRETIEDWIIRRLTAVGGLLYGEDELMLRWMLPG